MKVYRVKVNAMSREGFPGIYRGGRFWPAGESEGEVTEEGLATLRADTRLKVEVQGEEDRNTAPGTLSISPEDAKNPEKWPQRIDGQPVALPQPSTAAGAAVATPISGEEKQRQARQAATRDALAGAMQAAVQTAAETAATESTSTTEGTTEGGEGHENGGSRRRHRG